MKKLVVLITALVMSLSLVACGSKSEPAAKPSAPAAQPAAKPEAAKPEAAKPEAAKPEAAKPEAAKPAEDGEGYTLDYKTIASWVDAGFIGNDESGSPVVMAIDAENKTAIIIFGDNSDMTAASFVGPITYTDTTGTIEDEANGSSLTFGVKEVDKTTIELDMGDIGKATIKSAAKDEVLKTIKSAIDNYKHLA